MKCFRFGAATVIAMLATSGTASATTIIATLNSMTPQQSVTITLPSGSSRAAAGRFNFTRTGGDHPDNPLPDVPLSRFWAFCIELGQQINLGQSVVYDVVALENGDNSNGGLGATRADQVRELLGAVYPDFSQVLTNNQYAALQLAIWEITRENSAANGFNVLTGDVRFASSNATVLALANTFLAAVDGIGPRAERVVALTNRTRQDMLVQFPVPEPGSLGLALLGLGALVGSRRRSAR